jgi:hypothetical protein
MLPRRVGRFARICIEESVLSAESFDALVSPDAVTRLGSPPPEHRP